MDKTTTALDNILKLPHNSSAKAQVSPQVQNDVGAGGENPTGSKQSEQALTGSPSTRDLGPNETGDCGDTELAPPGILSIIGYCILRVVFYLAVLGVIGVAGLYIAKFTGYYDPCEKNVVSSSECTVTSFMKGFLYHVDCTEEKFCILPGFWSKTSRSGWSLKEPETTNSLKEKTE